MQAAVKVKEYYVPVELFTLLCPAATYILFKMGFPAESTFWAMIGAIILSHCVRIWCIRKYYSGFSLRDYFTSFVAPATMITLLVTFVIYLITLIMGDGILRLVVVLVASFTVVLSLAFFLGLNKSERYYLKETIKNRNKKG